MDAEGKKSTTVSDDMGRPVSVTTPDTGTSTYGYDPAGNLIRKTDAAGMTITYGYDLLDRLTAVSYPAFGGVGAWAVIYAYDEGADGKGRLTGVTDPSGQTSFSYNSRGRLASKTSTILKTDAGSCSFTMSRNLTAGGRVARVVYPAGRTVDFERNECACRVSCQQRG